MAQNWWEESQLDSAAPSYSGGEWWKEAKLEGEKEPGFAGHAKDLGLSLAKGVVAVPEAAVGLADLVTGGKAGKLLENEDGAFGFRPKQAKDFLSEQHTDAFKAKQQEFQSADGIMAKAGVALSNPSLVANEIAASLPVMGAGGVASRGLMAVGARGVAAGAGGVGPAIPGVLARTVGTEAAPLVAGALGEGIAGAGSAAEQMRQESTDGELTGKQAGLAALTGAATAGFGFAGGRAATKLGIGDVDTMIAQGATRTAGQASTKSIPRQMIEGAISEGLLEELPQSVSEQVLQNLALNKPWDDGVDGAIVMGTLAGMGMGGAAAGVAGFSNRGEQRRIDQEAARQEAARKQADIDNYVDTLPEHQQNAARAQLNAQLQAEARAAELADQEQAAPDIQPGNPSDYKATPAWAKPPEDALADYGNPDDEIQQSTGAWQQPQSRPDPVRQAVQQAADAGGALSAAAGLAMDSGAAPSYMPPVVEQEQVQEPQEDAVILQNRERNSEASIAQMQSIAAQPDYLRVGPSREMATGAPVVFGDLPGTALLGRGETVVDGRGSRVATQYAIVDAGDVIASNNADGTPVAEYAQGLPGKLRAVAGNGRTAGLQAAYQMGTAQQSYTPELLQDAQALGIDPQAVAGMQRPVLVRVMSKEDVTPNMGDRTNISSTLNLSAQERAANDINRIDVASLSFDDYGNPTEESLKGFVAATPESERGDMVDKSGPTRQASDRLMAAVFKQAYQDDELVRMYAQAQDPDARAVLGAVAGASGVMSNLSGAGEFDVRAAVADAVKMAVNAKRQGLKLSDVAQNYDMDISPEAYVVAEFMAQNARSPKRMAEGLRRWGQLALQQARIAEENRYQGGLLEPTPTLTREQIFAALGSESNPIEQAIAGRAPVDAGQSVQSDIDGALTQQTQEQPQPTPLPVPGNFSGTPTATMGTRTKAVAGPGFGPASLKDALAYHRARKQAEQAAQAGPPAQQTAQPDQESVQTAPQQSTQIDAGQTWAAMHADERKAAVDAAGLNKPQATKALSTSSMEKMPAAIADKLAPVLAAQGRADAIMAGELPPDGADMRMDDSGRMVQANAPAARQQSPEIKLQKHQQSEFEAGGMGLAGELDPKVQQSLLAMRNNPNVPDVPVQEQGWHYTKDIPDFVGVGKGFSLRGYTLKGAVHQEIKLPNGMVISRELRPDGTVVGNMEGDYRQIVEGQGFAEAQKLVEDFYASRAAKPAQLPQAAPTNAEAATVAAPALSTYTTAEVEAQQAQQEQATKAEAARKRAETAAATEADDRKRIAQASVIAADTFELGQDPMASLTGQKDVFADAAQEPEAAKPSPFGPIFEGFENNPEGAIAKLMQEKRGEVPDAFNHPELGSIGFVYGDNNMGLRHIEAKRGVEWVQRIPAILRTGRLERDPKFPRAYVIQETSPASVAVIRLDWDGKQKTWLVTAHPDDKNKWGGADKTSRTADDISGLVQGNPSQSTPQADSMGNEGAAQPNAETKPTSTKEDVAAARQAAKESDADNPAVSANTVFTEDAAAAARARLKKKMGQLNSGLDPEMMMDGITLAGYHIEKGARTFAAYAKAMLADLGDGAKPYLKSWYMGVKYDPRATSFTGMDSASVVDSADIDALMARKDEDVPSTDERLESNSNEPATERTVGNADAGKRGAVSGATGKAGGRATGKNGDGQPGDSGVPAGGSATGGERGNISLPRGDAAADAANITAGTEFSERGSDIGFDGVFADPIPAAQVDATTSKPLDRLAKAKQQRDADKVAVKPGDLANIKATLPYLLEGQQEDVLKTETRFAKPDGYGMLFTNGTGTGKTFTGLGVVKRLQRQGKNNILIVVPDDKIAADWIESGTPLGLSVSKLKDTKDAGQGITIATYANLGDNDALATRKWDMVVADEAHSLMQSADGTVTRYLSNLRAITNHPDGATQRHTMLHRKEIEQLRTLSEKLDGNNAILSNTDTMDAMMASVRAENVLLQKEADALAKQLREKSDAVRAEVQAAQGANRTRLLALSATPFAYEFTVDWANGYLFDYNEGRSDDRKEFRGYNQGSNRDQFFMQHFGYTMRYNKLNKPDPTKVDTGLLQRNFNGWLRKSGALSGRMLDVPADYDRRFVLVDSGIGNQIDEALNWLSEKSREAKGNNGYSILRNELHEKFDYLSRRYLLEAIKATEVIPIVRQHMAMGRKVVVFHDYKKGGGFNPFDISVPTRPADGSAPEQVQSFDEYKDAVTEFRAAFKDLVNAPLGKMDSPIDVFSREFPDVLLVNGDEKKSALLERYKTFQDDASGPKVMLVQSAKNKGWSGHDTTGKNQRVLINLGQPTAPTLAIQQEGRIYRTGQVTDAIMRYLNTGTAWEKMTFATTIAGRASAAENLGMGEQARALKDSFIAAFEESDAYPPGHEGEGKGGKERDKLANAAISAYDRAKTYYWATQKKTSKTKAQEGIDYFATPEPVGFKMAEWLGLRGSESALEPSAGHGAIARWLPEIANRTVIEPSNTLRARLAMVMDASKDRIVDGTFEDHAIVNKYDGIAMNPPFGVGGKTAIEHLHKAAAHLRDGGRIVALIPTGPAADSRFAQWLHGDSNRKTKPLYIHETLGEIHRGDTVTIGGIFGNMDVVADRVDKAESGFFVRAAGEDKLASKPLIWAKKVTPGPRKEAFRAAENIYTVGEIKLPQVTFERAGTAVATRIVILEKQTDAKRAPGPRAEIDLSSITDIKELFNRIEDINFGQRAMTAEQEIVDKHNKAGEKRESKAEAKPKTPKAANPDAAGTVDRNGAKVEKYITKKGKVLRGIVRTDLTKEAALKIDPYTFLMDGGYFIREVYLKPEDATPDIRFSRTDTPPPPARGVPAKARMAMFNRLADSIAAHWANAPKIEVVTNMDDPEIPESARKSDAKQRSNGASGHVEGFWHEGTVYLLTDNLQSAADAVRVLLHESLGHHGLRGVFGPQLDAILSKVIELRRDDVLAKAKQYGLDQSDETDLKEAAEEVLATMAQENPKLPLVRRAIAAIRSWLRQHVPMMGSLALTDDEIIRSYILPARGFVERGGSGSNAGTAVARQSRSDAADPAPRFSRVSQVISNAVNERKTVVAGSTNRYNKSQMDAMRDVGFIVEQPSLKERAQALWQDAGKKLAQGIVDQFAPVKEISKDAYALLRLSKGASGAFETLLKGGKLKLSDGVYNFDEASRGGVVDKLLTPLNGEHHDFFRWVAANRAERLMGEGRENLFTPEAITALKTLADGDLPFDYTVQHGIRKGRTTRKRAEAYRDSLNTFNAFNKNVLDMAEQSGLIDAESRATWENEFYVPFYRVADEESGGVRGMNIKGSVVRQKAFEQLKGGKQKLNHDLLDNTLMNWAHLLDAAAKNRAAKATLEAAASVGVAIEAPKGTLDSMAGSINKKDGIVWFMDGGQKRHFMVDDPYLMTAISSLEFAGMNSPIMNVMGSFKRALTIGVTASPFFKVRNLIRDSVQVIGVSGISANPLKNVADGWKLTDPKNDAYFRLLAGGGTIHFGTMMEGSEAKRVQALVESGVDDSTILNNDHKVKQFYRKFIEPGITAYNELGNRGEAVNRAALYDQLTKQGVSHAEASLMARDLMDFSMQGSFTSIRFLTQVVPFFNARLQGMHKLGRAAKEDPKRMAYVTGAIAMASLALLAAYGDDDDWKKREESDRNNFWWFKLGGTAFRIPKPFELGAIGTLAERSAEYLFDDEMTGKRFRAQVLKLMGDNLSMNPIPQAVKPILDVYANKDSFRDAPIESMGMEKLKPEYRFNDRTSMVARAASTAANAVTNTIGVNSPSPVQIDHLLRGYLGWLGTFAVGTADMITRPAISQPAQATPDYWKVATGGMVSDLRDAPSRYVSSIYDQAKELEQAYGTWRALQKSGKPQEAAEFFAENRDEITRHRSVAHVKAAESKLNERIRYIERSDMGSDTKREAIRAIRAQKEGLAKMLAQRG